MKFLEEDGIDFSWKTILYSIFCCSKWRCKNKKSKIYQDYQYFEKGHEQLQHELDIYQIVNSIRDSNILVSILFDQKQKILCDYQHSNLIRIDEDKKDNLGEQNSITIFRDKIESDINTLITSNGVDYTIFKNKIVYF